MQSRTTADDLRIATLDARKRTGDDSISTRVRDGRVQIVHAFPAKPTYRIIPISDYMDALDAILALDALPTARMDDDVYDPSRVHGSHFVEGEPS